MRNVLAVLLIVAVAGVGGTFALVWQMSGMLKDAVTQDLVTLETTIMQTKRTSWETEIHGGCVQHTVETMKTATESPEQFCKRHNDAVAADLQTYPPK